MSSSVRAPLTNLDTLFGQGSPQLIHQADFEDPIDQLIKMYECYLPPVVSSLFLEPTLHHWLDVRICVTVRDQIAFDTLRRSGQLKFAHGNQKHFLKLCASLLPFRRVHLPALYLVKTENGDSAVVGERSDVLAVFDRAMSYLRKSGQCTLKKAQQHTSQYRFFTNTPERSVRPRAHRPFQR